MVSFNKKTNIGLSASDDSANLFPNQTSLNVEDINGTKPNQADIKQAAYWVSKTNREKWVTFFVKFLIGMISVLLALFGWFLINYNGPVNRLEQFKDTSEKRLDKIEDSASSTNKRINKLEKGLVEYKINISTED